MPVRFRSLFIVIFQIRGTMLSWALKHPSRRLVTCQNNVADFVETERVSSEYDYYVVPATIVPLATTEYLAALTIYNFSLATKTCQSSHYTMPP